MNFQGFPAELPSFLGELKANNTREWFEAHRSSYDMLFLEPAKAFVQAMDQHLDDLCPGLNAVPKINGSIRRLNRDTRFGKDKSPYHVHMHLIFWKGNKAATAPGFHLVISPRHVGVGCGIWMFSDEELTRFRAAMMSKQGVEGLREAVDIALTVDGQTLDEPALKRVPKGYDDAPDPVLLRHKGVVVRGDIIDASPIFSSQAVDHVLTLFRTQMPLLSWLDQNVAQP